MSEPVKSKAYLPTRKQIAEACARIREEWSEREHRRRAGMNVGRHDDTEWMGVDIQVVRVSE